MIISPTPTPTPTPAPISLELHQRLKQHWAQYPGPQFPDFWREYIRNHPEVKSWLWLYHRWVPGQVEPPTPPPTPTPRPTPTPTPTPTPVDPTDWDSYFSPIWDEYYGPDNVALWQQFADRYGQPFLDWLTATYGWVPGQEGPPTPPTPPPPPWLEKLEAGTLPREWEFPMAGLPRYPTAEHWYRMSESERRGLQGTVETHEGSWPDYQQWMIKSWVPGTEKRLQPEWIWK